MPIFINAIPVSLGNDAYPIAIFASYLLHTYLPVLRDMVAKSPALKVRLDRNESERVASLRLPYILTRFVSISPFYARIVGIDCLV